MFWSILSKVCNFAEIRTVTQGFLAFGFFQVQAVLLLLGGYEVPTGIPAPGMVPPNQRVPFILLLLFEFFSYSVHFYLISLFFLLVS